MNASVEGSMPNRPPVTGPAINLATFNQYSTAFPYLNVVKSAFTDWSSGTLDGDGNIVSLAQHATASRNIWAHDAQGFTSGIRPGRWIFKWSGPDKGVDLTIAGNGISNVVRGANRASFDVELPGGTQLVRVSFVNKTGSAAFPISNLTCVHSDHESLLDSGEIFNPDYLASMPRKLSAIRTMKAAQIENNTATEASQVRLESNGSWTCYDQLIGTGSETTGMPYTVQAKLAVKMRCVLHTCFPVRGTQAQYDFIARQLWSVLSSHPDIRVLPEVGNENWNDSYSHRAWLNNVYGPNQRSSRYARGINGPQAEAQKTLMVWKALALAGFPRSQVIRSFAFQLFGSFREDAYTGQAMNYVDSEGLVSAGAKFHTLLDSLVTAPYTHINVDGKLPSDRGTLYHTRLMNLDWANLTDAQLLAYFANGTESMHRQIVSMVSEAAAALGRTVPIGCYEWGHEVLHRSLNFAGVFYQGTIDKSDNTFVWSPEYLPVSFTDGDHFWFQNTYDGSAAGTPNKIAMAPSVETIAKRKSANKAWFFASDAARLADTTNTGAGSIPLTGSSAKVSFYTCDNITRHRQFSKRMGEFLNSAAGRTMYENLYSQTIGPGLLAYPCQLVDIGDWAQDDTNAQFWGLKHGPRSASVPRHEFYRNL